MLWRCWLGRRKGSQLMPLPLTVSCFSKIQVDFQIDFTFLVLAHLGSPGQRAVKRVFVCEVNAITNSKWLRKNTSNQTESDERWCLDCSLHEHLTNMHSRQHANIKSPLTDESTHWMVNSPTVSKYVSNKCIAVRKVATPLRGLTCHMGSHSVTCHPAEVTFPPLPQLKMVLN